MKTRKGFVSNSSTSSYTIVCEKSAWEKTFESLTPLEKEIVKELGFETKRIAGLELVVLSSIHGNYDSLDHVDTRDLFIRAALDPNDPEEDIWEARCGAEDKLAAAKTESGEPAAFGVVTDV